MKKATISKFKELPKTKLPWWAMVLGLSTIIVMPLLSIFVSVIRPLIDKITGGTLGIPLGFGLGAVSVALVIPALITSLAAFGKGERSWVLWAGFLPAVLAGAFWIFMFFGELIFPH